MESRGRHRWSGCCLSFRLCGLLLEVGDQVVPVLALLQATKRHLGSWNVLLWVLEVLKLSLLSASHSLFISL